MWNKLQEDSDGKESFLRATIEKDIEWQFFQNFDLNIRVHYAINSLYKYMFKKFNTKSKNVD